MPSKQRAKSVYPSPQPGQIVIGADSHTCSAGGVGAWACGLGAADVVLPMVTGETWVRVPETVKVRLF
jgi:homoaconitate hydratase